MYDSQDIGMLVSEVGSPPTKAPEDAEPYCLDCFNKSGIKRPLPDGWWGEKRRIWKDGKWYALCHVHSNKRERKRILGIP